MDPVVAAFGRELTNAHNAMKRALEGASPEALAWTSEDAVYPSGNPGDTRWNSLAMLVRHTTGAEKTYANAVAGREGRFDAALNNDPATAEELTALVEEAETYVMDALSQFGPGDFASPGVKYRNGTEFTKLESLFRLIGHTTEHKGHMVVLRKMLRERGLA